MRYRHKSKGHEVDAYQWKQTLEQKYPIQVTHNRLCNCVVASVPHIHTKKGITIVNEDDWVTVDCDGNVKVYSSDIFNFLHEEVK